MLVVSSEKYLVDREIEFSGLGKANLIDFMRDILGNVLLNNLLRFQLHSLRNLLPHCQRFRREEDRTGVT